MVRESSRFSRRLENEIATLRRTALQLRATLADARLRRRLDRAIRDLETFPRQFTTEEGLQQALARPRVWIQNVREAAQDPPA